MATSALKNATGKAQPRPKTYSFAWTGKNVRGKDVKGEIRATSENDAKIQLRKQSVQTKTLKKKRGNGKKIKGKDIAIFTRQLATMMKSGVPMLQSIEIAARGSDNSNISKLLYDIKTSLENGESLSASFAEHPRYFNKLYCNLISAGEAAGILEEVLERLAIYQEKSEALKSKIKSALFYPSAIIGAAIVITAVIMIFVIPAFKTVFANFGAELPLPTQIVMGISEFMVSNWYLIFGALAGVVFTFIEAYKRSEGMRNALDKWMLQIPVFGELMEKAVWARWTRTLSTMFAAGVPLVDALTSVGGASGNNVYLEATKKIQAEVSTGSSLTDSMTNVDLFPSMALQLISIGEETGALDSMLAKAADMYEQEVDNAVEAISQLMEPMIMVVLGTLIGGIVIAMYLPIFKMGAAV